MENLQNAIAIFKEAVRAVKPSTLIRKRLQWEPPWLSISNNLIEVSATTRIFIIGAGKASALMAQTMEEILGDAITDGIVVTKYEHALQLNKIKHIEAGHPIHK